jgi:hypothetical protein
MVGLIMQMRMTRMVQKMSQCLDANTTSEMSRYNVMSVGVGIPAGIAMTQMRTTTWTGRWQGICSAWSVGHPRRPLSFAYHAKLKQPATIATYANCGTTTAQRRYIIVKTVVSAEEEKVWAKTSTIARYVLWVTMTVLF